MRVLVTGGTGFIGRYLVERLVELGHEVSNLDLYPSDWPAPFVRSIAGDLRDRSAIDAALEGCRAVFHLAAAHHDFGIDGQTYFDVNEIGSRVLCDALNACGIADVCFYSSVAVYGDVPEPREEAGPVQPVTAYGASKLAGERVFDAWARAQPGRRALVIRPSVTFGPRNQANMYSLIRQIHARRFVPVGPGTNVKSMCYVENLVDATLHLWRTSAVAGIEIYNYVDKPDLTSREIERTIFRALQRRPPRYAVPLRFALALATPFELYIAATGRNVPVSRARIRKLAQQQTRFEARKIFATGFRPRFSLEDGIRRMVEWFLAEGHARPAVWRVPRRRVRPDLPV